MEEREAIVKAVKWLTGDLHMAIIPIKSGKKSPVSKHGLEDASDEPGYVAGQFYKHPEWNVGIVCGFSNVLVIDVDVDAESDKDGMESLRAWELEHGELPETWSAITPRGGQHFYFRCTEGDKIGPHTSEELCIDIRAGKSYVLCPPSKMERGDYVWENHPDDFELAYADDHVMSFVQYVLDHSSGKKEESKFTIDETVKAGSRNDTLYKLGCSMLGSGLNKETILTALMDANKRQFEPPLSDDEVRRTWESVCRHKVGMSDEAKAKADKSKTKNDSKNGGPYSDLTPKSQSAEWAEVVVKETGLVRIGGFIALWDEGRYKVGVNELDKYLIKHIKCVSHSKRHDIREDAMLMAPDVDAAPDRFIAFRNGVLDTESDSLELVPYDKDMHIVNIIPHDFVYGAHSELIDTFLEDLSCGDKDTWASMVQALTLCMLRTGRYAKCPILLGRGANGKSTYLRFIRYIIGDENISSMSLYQCGERFMSHLISGKLANIGDDISNERISGDAAENWKKMVTGERITCDIKGSAQIEVESYATLIFSANEMPSLGDSSDGMMRRLFPIPFDADFTKNNSRDTHMAEKICTEECASAMIWLAVSALRTMRVLGGVIESRVTREMVDSIKDDNNSVFAYITDCEMDADNFIGKEAKTCYEDYCIWCRDSGLMHPFSRQKFSRTINAKFDLETFVHKEQGRKNIRKFRTISEDKENKSVTTF